MKIQSARPLSLQRQLVKAVAVVAAGLAVYLCVTFFVSRGGFGTLPRQTDLLRTSFEAIGLVLVGIAVRAVRWNYYANRLGWRVPIVQNTIVFVASFALTATPGKVGELIKASLLSSRYGVSAVQCAGTLVIERLCDVAAVVILALLGASLVGTSAWVVALVTGIVIVVMVAMLRSRRIRARIVRRIEGDRPSPFFVRLHGMLEATAALLTFPSLALGVLLAIISWSCEGVATYVVFQAVGVAMPLWTAVSAYAVATLIGAVSMLPGGVGGFEGTLIFQAKAAGATVAQATAATFLFRLCSLWFASLLGTVVLLAWTFVMRERPSAGGGAQSYAPGLRAPEQS